MKLIKIRIENYKSIDSMEFDIVKYNNSYTTSFVGINEVGKSNILEAMSFLEVPNEHFEFLEISNQNNDTTEYVDLYFYMCFENKETYMKILKEKIVANESFIKSISINKIEKNVSLADYTTFQIGGPAKYFLKISSKKELKQAIQWAKAKQEKIYILANVRVYLMFVIVLMLFLSL